jgi:nitrite reductase (NADH) small subunit
MESIVLGHISDFSERRSKVFVIGDMEIAVFKLSNQTVKAIENRCPHKNGKLAEGIVCDQHVFCPLHDWKINLHDGCVQEPDQGQVRTFHVEVNVNGDVIFDAGGILNGETRRESHSGYGS